MDRVLYILACIFVPLTWGLLVVWVSRRIDRRTAHHPQRRGNVIHPDDPTRIEYHI